MKKSLSALAFFALLACPILAQQKTFIHCGQLIDGVAEKAFSEMTIIVEGQKISDVKSGFLKPANGETIIDLSKKTVLPGLIDLHVHIEGEQNRSSYMDRFTQNDIFSAYKALKYGQITLNAGFTTVRDLGGSGANLALRDAINQGLVEGPRIFTSGKTICITGGHGDPSNGSKEDLWEAPGALDGVADGPDACRRETRNQLKRGADCIKITATGGVLSVAKDGYRPSFSKEEIEAVVTVASDAGVIVAAHAHGDEGMRRAVEAGVTTIEHGTLMTEETMDLMIKKGTWYVPTLTAGRAVADSAKVRGFFPPMIAAKAAFIGPQIQKTFEKAHKRGVKIAFGTDSGVSPHGRNALEFQFMCEAGMAPMAAIKTATVNAAEVLKKRDQLGSIEKGRFADIIAVDGDPIADIKILQKVSFVMKDGAVVKR